MSKNKKLVKLQIKGVIVDAWYDEAWATPYIEKGLFTPVSRFLAQLDAAEKAGADVEITVSSQGGSVVAGNDMLFAIQQYPYGKSITIGAFAASMAANIILQAGCTVRAHKNSILLYHGAWSYTIGGQGAHSDTSKLLEQMNEPIKAALLGRGVPENMVEDGFADDRQFTMSATEAQKWGIVDEIIGEDAALNARLTEDDERGLLQNGATLDIAACAAWQDEMTSGETTGTTETTEQTTEPETTEQTTEPETTEQTTEPETTEQTSEPETAEQTSEPETAEQTSEPETTEPETTDEAHDAADVGQLRAQVESLQAQIKAVQSAADKRIAAMEKTHAAEIRNLETARADVLAEYEAYRAESAAALETAQQSVATTNELLAASQRAHATLVGNVLAETDAVETWPTAVAKHGLAEALRRYPELKQEYKNKINSKNKD